jgi:20S proteasome alpha/beta subunit
LAENSVLRRVGLDYDTFLQQQRNLAPELVSALMSAYRDVELDIELLIAGVDNTGAHLYLISDPGITNCFDSIGYTAIGSGLPHAESFLTEADYSPGIPLNRAVWLCYVAKRRSERAPGVGSKYTDVLVIDREQGVQFLDDQTLHRLDSIYQQYLASLLEATRAIDQSVADLAFTYQS